MRVLVYFQPKSPKYDGFEGARLRKTIKGALESVGVTYTSELVDNYDIAHFLSIEDENKVDYAVDKGVPVVVSCMYCEDDPVAAFVEYKNKNGNKTYSLKSKALKFLQKANLIQVPTEFAKNFLIENGVDKPIVVIPVGVNVSRFDFSRDDEKDIFYRYFSEDRNKKLVIGAGEYTQAMDGITAFINVGKKHPNINFHFFGKLDYHKLPRKIKKHLKDAPKNIKFNGLVPDDVYRSAMMNADLFMVPGYNYSGSINIIEAMAAKCQIVSRIQNKENFDLLINEETAYLAEFSETLTSLASDYLQGKIKPTIEKAYEVVKEETYQKFGQNLVSSYDDTIKKYTEEKGIC